MKFIESFAYTHTIRVVREYCLPSVSIRRVDSFSPKRNVCMARCEGLAVAKNNKLQQTNATSDPILSKDNDDDDNGDKKTTEDGLQLCSVEFFLFPSVSFFDNKFSPHPTDAERKIYMLSRTHAHSGVSVFAMCRLKRFVAIT